MMIEIIRALIAIKEINKVTSDLVSCWAKIVEVQREQKALLETIKKINESKEFDTIMWTIKENQITRRAQEQTREYPHD